MLRAVVDTNITVSGLLFGGLPLKVIHAAIARRFVWVTSPVLMDETERVLRSDKFGLSTDEIKALISPIFGVAEIVIPIHTLDVIERCPADNRVLECAVEGKCSAIVSGDRRDLLSLKTYRHVEIITARQFLDRV
ncbi:putative toxin-antitoxin system toxin component, PIN family [Bdellovibrionota bacterium FG-1]